MKTILTILLIVAVGAFGIADAQQAPPPGAGPMGPGMMAGMHQQMMGLMQQMGGMMQQMGEMMASGQMSPERMKQMGDAMKQMGQMIGGMGAGEGWMGPMAGYARDVEDDGAHGRDAEAHVGDDGRAEVTPGHEGGRPCTRLA